jgi:hypothetical protein
MVGRRTLNPVVKVRVLVPQLMQTADVVQLARTGRGLTTIVPLSGVLIVLFLSLDWVLD